MDHNKYFVLFLNKKYNDAFLNFPEDKYIIVRIGLLSLICEILSISINGIYIEYCVNLLMLINDSYLINDDMEFYSLILILMAH